MKHRLVSSVAAAAVLALGIAACGGSSSSGSKGSTATGKPLVIETTALSLTQVAFAAGFASVRQFNDTVRLVFATTPTELRRYCAT